MPNRSALEKLNADIVAALGVAKRSVESAMNEHAQGWSIAYDLQELAQTLRALRSYDDAACQLREQHNTRE